jgi:transcriptional regulator with XRE-family HTH domain
MGKVSDALKQVLGEYGISQNQIAVALGIERPIFFRWFHGQVDPSAETVAEIARAIQNINDEASRDFARLYLGYGINSEQEGLIVPEVSQLPQFEDLDVSALSRLFSDTTTSYKFLFFISLLDILKRRQFDVLSPISFQEIIVEMLANAWYPHTYFKLSFGSQDKIAQKLDSLALEITEPILKFTDTNKKLLRKTIASQNLKDVISHLKKYVPFRLIIPFLEHELEGINRGRGNELDVAMPAIAEKYFEAKKPLYRFDSNKYSECQSIIVHPDWASYIEEYYAIVRGWASWEWLNYMQQRNSSVPGIVNKIFMPQQRGSLSHQVKYWKSVLQHQSVDCIYSNQPLTVDRIALDHYIPWSFVAHDQIWNLVPVIPEVNSSKSNNLPDAQYFKKFVVIQHLGLTISHSNLGEKAWNNLVEPFISDLKIRPKDLLDLQQLENAYKTIVQPLMILAERQGFSPNWIYNLTQ